MNILPEDLYTLLHIGLFIMLRANQKSSFKDLLIVPLEARSLDYFQTELERRVGLLFKRSALLKRGIDSYLNTRARVHLHFSLRSNKNATIERDK
jgi:hypothetical protein